MPTREGAPSNVVVARKESSDAFQVYDVMLQGRRYTVVLLVARGVLTCECHGTCSHRSAVMEALSRRSRREHEAACERLGAEARKEVVGS